MNALIKGLAVRRVEHRSEIHSNESQHLAKGAEVARLRRRFFLVLQQALSFRMGHHLNRQVVVLAGARRLRSQGTGSVHVHFIERITRSEGRKEANGNGDGKGNGGRNGKGNGGGDGDEDRKGDADGDGAGTGTGEEAREQKQDRNGDGSGDWVETETRAETRGHTPDGDGDGSGDGNEDSMQWRREREGERGR